MRTKKKDSRKSKLIKQAYEEVWFGTFEMSLTQAHGDKQAVRSTRLDLEKNTGLETQIFRKQQTEGGFERKLTR